MQNADSNITMRQGTENDRFYDAMSERWSGTNGSRQDKPCTCHPDDKPPVPCAKQYALGDCRAASILKLRKEYRPSMDKEVLHSWAADVVKEIDGLIGSGQPAQFLSPREDA